jgi:hypothetical protein
MSGGHVLVQSLDSICAGHLTVLLVHIVGAGARVVTDPDAEVLDRLWVLLVNLRVALLIHGSICSCLTTSTYHIKADDLTTGLLNLSGLAEEVPES